jgi:hypothetical protein
LLEKSKEPAIDKLIMLIMNIKTIGVGISTKSFESIFKPMNTRMIARP